MSLFHPRVINKRIEGKNVIPDEHNRILSAWIQSLKDGVFDRETSNDSEFIQRIMVEVLGYTGSSQGSHWTLQKNQPIASGNVDIALGSFSNEKESILAPFELKGAKTQDLDAIMPGRNKSPVQQAWEYAMDAKGAQWVLVSNYRVIRLYAVGYGRKDYELFNIEELLDPGQYARFILLLSAQNLLGGLSLELLKESDLPDISRIYGEIDDIVDALAVSTFIVNKEGIPEVAINTQSTQASLEKRDTQAVFTEVLISELSKLVEFGKLDDGFKPVLSVEEDHLLRQQVNTNLNIAQLSLLRRDNEIFQESLSEAKELLIPYLQFNAELERIHGDINALDDIVIEQKGPSLSRSLAYIRNSITKVTGEEF